MTFFQQEKVYFYFNYFLKKTIKSLFQNPAAPTVDMNEDLKRIDKPLETLIRGESEDNTSEKTKIYFDNLHLSPLKVKRRFSSCF